MDDESSSSSSSENDSLKDFMDTSLSKENKRKILKLKKVQDEMKKDILTSPKLQSKITNIRPLSSNFNEKKYPIKTPFNIEPKKVPVQKSIKMYSTIQSTNPLLNNKSFSTNPSHKMSSNVFFHPQSPPFTSKYTSTSSGLKQPRFSMRIRSPKFGSSSGGKMSKLQSLRKDFNLQRDQIQIQNRRVPNGRLPKHTHINPYFNNNNNNYNNKTLKQ